MLTHVYFDETDVYLSYINDRKYIIDLTKGNGIYTIEEFNYVIKMEIVDNQLQYLSDNIQEVKLLTNMILKKKKISKLINVNIIN